MRKLTITISILMLTITAAQAQMLSGKVIKIADGDTLTILEYPHKQHRIRLAQIDAPEKAQDFGQKSKQSLSDLCFGKMASVEVVDTDRYNREVGVVTCSGKEANYEQVKSGMAWVYDKYANDPKYFQAQKYARSNSLGLWCVSSPTPPWEYRSKKRNAE